MRLGLLFPVLALTTATATWAGASRVMLVVVPQDEAAQGTALTSQPALAAMLAHDDRLELVDPASRYAPQSAADAEKQVAAGKTALQELERLLAGVDYEGARTKAEQTLATLRTADFRAVRELYLQVLLQLARIKQALQADDSGASELAQAFAIDPQVAPLRGGNSEERKAFDAARVLVAASSRAAPVVIEGDQVRGWLWVDGRFRGVTPVTISDLVPGRHFVTFTAPGGQVTSQTELFGSITRLAVGSQLTPEGRTYRALAASLAAGFAKQQPGGAARALLAWAQVDEVIGVGLSTKAPTALVRVSSAGVARSGVKEKTDEATVAAIRQLVDEPLKSEVAASAPETAPPQSVAIGVVQAESHPSKVPGWVLIGAGVVAAGAGVGMLVAGQAQFQGAGKIPQVEQNQYSTQVKSANELAGGGLAALGVGVVVAGVGVYFVW